MGEVLIAGTASLLICMFLSPKFIEFLRNREFGQHIREDGPEGHHVKAGTPTMGGIIIVLAVAVPFLILSNYDWRAVGVFGTGLACAVLGFCDDYTKIVKRRSLGLRARTKLGVTIAISIWLWWTAHHKARAARPPAPELRRRVGQHRLPLSGDHLPRRRRHDQRASTSPTVSTASPAAAPRSSSSPTSGSRSSRPASTTCRC